MTRPVHINLDALREKMRAIAAERVEQHTMRIPEHGEALGVILLIWSITLVLLFILWLNAGTPWVPDWLR